jgi:hypothetical protein
VGDTSGQPHIFEEPDHASGYCYAAAKLEAGAHVPVTVHGPGRVIVTLAEDDLNRYIGVFKGLWTERDLERPRDEWR